MEDKVAHFTWKGSWKRTALLSKERQVPWPYQRLALQGFFSGLLYARWYRSHVPLDQYRSLSGPPGIDKRSGLSLQEFIEEYETPNKPVILTDVVPGWPAYKEWQMPRLLEVYGDTLFKTNGTGPDGHCFKMTLKNYYAYMRGNRDEKPLYMFDNKFFQRAPAMLNDYEVPKYFKEDLFECNSFQRNKTGLNSLADMTQEDRPDYRWILIGPERSGSPLHQDPHRTSAWNALIMVF